MEKSVAFVRVPFRLSMVLEFLWLASWTDIIVANVV